MRDPTEPGPGLSHFDFTTIKVPLLFVHHASDECQVTPYGDAARLADKYPLDFRLWRSCAESGPCDPFSAHGFFGREPETVEEIVNWMMKKPFRERRFDDCLKPVDRVEVLSVMDNSIDVLMGNTPVARAGAA